MIEALAAALLVLGVLLARRYHAARAPSIDATRIRRAGRDRGYKIHSWRPGLSPSLALLLALGMVIHRPDALEPKTAATMPATTSAGRIHYQTDGVRGLYLDSGTKMFHADGGTINVLAYGAIGDGATDDRAAIESARAAAAALGNGAAVYFPPGTYKVSSALTFGTTVAAHFAPGAILSVDPAVTVTLNGDVIAGQHRIFSGAGTIALPYVSNIFVRWFGALGDGVTDDTAAIQKSIETAEAGRRPNVVFGTGVFAHAATIALDAVGNGVSLIGTLVPSLQAGSTGPSTTLKWIGGASPQVLITGSFYRFSGISFQNFGTATHAVRSVSGSREWFQDCCFALPNLATKWSTACIELATGYGYVNLEHIESHVSPLLKVTGAGNGTTIKLRNSVLDAPSGAGTAYIVLSDAATGDLLEISGCTFDLFGGQTRGILDMSTITTGEWTNIHIHDCEFDGNADPDVTLFVAKVKNCKQFALEDCSIDQMPNITSSPIQLTNSRGAVRRVTGASLGRAIISTQDTTSYAYPGTSNFTLANTSGMMDAASQSGNLIPVTPAAGIARLKGNLGDPMSNMVFLITATTNSAFEVQVAQPLDGDRGYLCPGQRFTVAIKNSSGAAMGAVTFQATLFNLRFSDFQEPANDELSAVHFIWDGAKAWEIGRDLLNSAGVRPSYLPTAAAATAGIIPSTGATDAMVSATAAIAKSKLAPLAIVNADVDAAAAIAKSKLAPLAIVNADVDAAAAIAYTKLNLATSIVNADVAAGAAIVGSKVATATTALRGVVLVAATDADLGAQVSAGDAGGVGTVSAAANLATKASVDTALAAIVADINDLKAKLRTAGTLNV